MNAFKTKTAILGAGSIGCYLGGLLASQGIDVVFLGRKKLKHAVEEKGLTLTHFENDTVHIDKNDINVSISAEALSDCSIVLLCTKSQDTQTAAEQIKEYSPIGTRIISCQNGVTNVPLLKRVLGDNDYEIISSIVPFNVTPTSLGTFHCGTDGTLHVSSAIPQALQEAFAKAKQDIAMGENFEGDQWAKLLINLNNGLNTLSGTTLRKSLAQKPYRQALRLCLLEAKHIVETSGVKLGTFNGRSPDLLMKTLNLPNWAYKIVMQLIVKIDEKARSSMLDDLEIGRPTEVDALQGEIISLGQNYDIDAVYNRRILDAVKHAFDKVRSPYLSGGEILDLVLKG